MIILVAATAVVKGADWFVESAVWLASRTGLSEMTVGATIVALATTLPETVVSGYASYTGHSDLAMGNAVGSCLANGGLILGVAAVLGGFTSASIGFRGRCLSLVGVTAIVMWMTRDGAISRLDAVGLLCLVAAIIFLTVRGAQQDVTSWATEPSAPNGAPAEQGVTTGSPSPVLKFLFGAALIALGSRFLVSAGTELAARLGLSEAVVGLTLVSIGTSLPELATTVAAAMRRHHDLALGNLLGANMLNLSLVLGVSGLIRPLPVDGASATVYLPLVATLTIMLLLFSVVRRGVGRPEGLTLLVLYAAYMGVLFR